VSDAHRIAGVEIGGTKVAAMLWQDGVVIDEVRVSTGDPDATFERLFAGVGRWWETSPFQALGVGSFGPVTLDPLAKDFGCIRTTPKPGWTGTAVLPRLARRFPCPIGIETDVNAAALAEHRWGHGRGADSLVYLTIGTGVGGGVLQGGRPLHGRLHPELGHLLLRRQPGDDFAGTCVFHRDCVEGLLSGPALRARFKADPAEVPASDPRWNVVVADLAAFLCVLLHSLAPNRILIGGGVGLGAPWIVERVPSAMVPLLGDYYPELDASALAEMIKLPGLGVAAGPLGAIAIGLAALENSTRPDASRRVGASTRPVMDTRDRDGDASPLGSRHLA
jgi:fructokinase